MSRDATQYRARHDAALAAELKARRAAERRCSFCNAEATVADCGGDCTARCCVDCIDADTGLCTECAVEAKRLGRPRDPVTGFCLCRTCVEHRAAALADLQRHRAGVE